MLLAHTDEEIMIRETADRLAADLLEPNADALDRGEGRDRMLGNLKTLAEQGFMGLNIKAEHGGSEAGAVAFALSVEAFAAACASTTVTVSVTNMVGEVIQSVGSDDQKRAYLPPLCDGTFPAAAFCLTESGAGSDPAGMVLSARMDGNEWVLNGSKIYISSAEYAGLFVVWAVTDPHAPKGKGISCFLIEAGTPGMTVGRPERKMGQTGSATSSVTFEDCRIPAGALMGQENDGYRIAVAELTGGRIGVSALALGIARAAMHAAKAYVSERRQFDKRIADMQGIQWMIADRETELEAARLLMLQAAHLKDQGADFRKAASMAKLYASEAAQRATYAAIQLHGGAGYLADYKVERLARDARITTIYEGTSEIQRMIIAREVLKDYSAQA
jgi:alkylation response protein AidB-like acyl-CoA dehydrogenase